MWVGDMGVEKVNHIVWYITLAHQSWGIREFNLKEASMTMNVIHLRPRAPVLYGLPRKCCHLSFPSAQPFESIRKQLGGQYYHINFSNHNKHWYGYPFWRYGCPTHVIKTSTHIDIGPRYGVYPSYLLHCVTKSSNSLRIQVMGRISTNSNSAFVRLACVHDYG